jgi:hypothetical protein
MMAQNGILVLDAELIASTFAITAGTGGGIVLLSVLGMDCGV